MFTMLARPGTFACSAKLQSEGELGKVQKNNTVEGSTPRVEADAAVVSLETWPQPRSSAKVAAGIATAADLKAEGMEGIPNSPATRQNRREFWESDLTT
jgi:hypothetical protein